MSLASVVWAVVLALVAWRAEMALRAVWRGRVALQERELALRERELALVEQRQTVSEELEELPADLQLRIRAESELWAQGQLRSLVQQLYARHKDWDMVRAEVSAMDAAAIMAEHGWSQTAVVS